MQTPATPSDQDFAIPDSEMLLAGLEQSDSEVEAERELQQQELDATEGWRWYVMNFKLWIEQRRQVLARQLRGSGISIAVHVAILLILASLFMKVEDDSVKGLVITSSPPSSDPVQEVVIEPTLPTRLPEATEAESNGKSTCAHRDCAGRVSHGAKVDGVD